ncbi:PucR family transcriptional regulator [Streptomyces lasalocidi]
MNGAGVCTLGDLLDAVGGSALRLLAAPAGPGVPVTEVVLHDDSGAPPPPLPGALLLAVGVPAAQTEPLLRAAARAGMAGVVVRGADGPVARAEAYGVALLSVPPDAAWHHVHLELAAAVAARPGAGAGADGGALGDLFALADAIATATGGATAVEDPGQRILAYSAVPGQPVDEDRRQGILGRQVPASAENAEQYRRLFAADRPLRLPALPGAGLPRLAMPVRAGGETLGSVWVIDGGALAPDAEESLAQGASTAALLLLRARAARELARHRGGELLRRLLDGTAPDPATAARRLGVTAPARVAAFALDLDRGGSVPDAERTALRLLDAVRLQCEARYGRHAGVLLDGVVYAVLPAPGERHKQLAEDIAARAGRALRVPVRAALGEQVTAAAELAASRADADLVLRVLDPTTPVATADEVRPRITLLRLAELMGGQREFSEGAWRRILAHDAGHGTEYARTALSWLTASCDMSAAAELLSVHPNTVRYRLRGLRQHTGVDLTDPDERLVLWLQARVLGDGPDGPDRS